MVSPFWIAGAFSDPKETSTYLLPSKPSVLIVAMASRWRRFFVESAMSIWTVIFSLGPPGRDVLDRTFMNPAHLHLGAVIEPGDIWELGAHPVRAPEHELFFADDENPHKQNHQS